MNPPGPGAALAEPVGDVAAPASGIDLSTCDREPIHVPGHIQPFGFLFALATDGRVVHASANIGEYSGRPVAEWLGRPIETLIDGDALHRLRNHVTILHGPDAVQRSFALKLIDGRPRFDVAVHLSDGLVVVEAEPAMTDEREAAALVRAMVARLKHSDGLATFLADGARHVQALTGFNRVMVYRFNASGDGEVIAEALRGRRDAYLGLHYPASDIPVQARALYIRTPFRVIADVASMPVPIAAMADMPSLDLSLSVLRAVSPLHIEYLVNMEVAASLSISIIVDGRLWGLFACHHDSPRLPSLVYRTAAELFGEMFSMMLEGRLRREAHAHELRARALAQLLIAEVAHDGRVLTDPQRLGELIFDTIPADGIGIHLGDIVALRGSTPDHARFVALTAALAARAADGVVVADSIATIVPEAAAYADRAAGMIAIPLASDRQDHVILFRTEQTRTLRWAGDPEKSTAENDGRIAPRQSFAAWGQQVRGACSPFTLAERSAADAIRVAFLETLVRSNALSIRADSLAQGGQDMLIAELNHRVRNILSLIRGLISQTRGSAETSDNFIANLDERVQSLARAHDQITSDRWGPARLKDLVATEADAYLGARRDRIVANGPNVLIQPTAFTTLALVLHELMTNAAKYGALSDGGSVLVAWDIDDGDLRIDWSERDGPAVFEPSRRGFGSTIIERSIPYDLGGSALLDYRPAGFHAEFRVPARHLAGVAIDDPDGAAKLAAIVDRPLLEGLAVLLVEDSIIIAMDCADTLSDLGAASVTTVASVADALAAIGARDFQFALLDYNLGNETSLAIADELLERAVPYAFATGYDGDIQKRGHANAPVIGKPYGRKQLTPLLLRLGFGA